MDTGFEDEKDPPLHLLVLKEINQNLTRILIGTNIIILIVLGIILIARWIHQKRANTLSIHTKVKLLVFTGNKNMLVDLPDILDFCQNLDFKLCSPLSNLHITGIFRPRLHFLIEAYARNKFTGTRYEFPQSVELTFLQAAKLNKMLVSPFGVNLLYKSAELIGNFETVSVANPIGSITSEILAITAPAQNLDN